MPDRFFQFGVCCLAISLSLPDFLAAQTASRRRKLTTDIKEIVLENRFVSRTFAVDTGWLRTSRLANLLTGENVVISSPEFEIQFENEPVLSSQDFVAEYYTHVLLPGEVKRTIFALTEKRQRLRLELEYTLGPGDFFVHKRVRLYPLQRSLPRLLSVSVEALKVGNVRSSWPSTSPRGPQQKPPVAVRLALPESPGQPVFLNDSFFWGMEHPAGRSRLLDGIIRCTQHPGSRISSSGFESHPVVAGISPRGEIGEWFLRYVDTFRLAGRPLTILDVQRNGIGNALLADFLERKMEAIPKIAGRSDRRLVDVLVLDAGWQTESYSLGSVSQVLRSRGVGLGVYFPLSSSERGTSKPSAKGNDFSQDASNSNGEPAVACLADPKYKEVLRNRLKEIHQGNPLNFIRHDLNTIQCQTARDSLEEQVSYEAATEALIEVLRFERSLDSDLHVSLVGKELPSPWWLQYANDVGPEDAVGQGPLRMDLSPRPRDWQLQREGIPLQEYFSSEYAAFPISRLAASVLHEAIESGIGPKEPNESWADAVAEYLGRGQDLTELSFDPEQLDASAWEILRRGLDWKASRQPVFRHGWVIGGTLQKGEPYGYLNWNGSRAIAVLRNPSPFPREISFHLPRSLRGSLRVTETYPRCRIESQSLKAGDIVNTSLEGLESRVLEFDSEAAFDAALPLDADFLISSNDTTHGEERQIAVKVFPESSEVRFSQPQDVAGLQLAGSSVSLDPSGHAQIAEDPRLANFIDAQKLFAQKRAEVGVYAKRGVQLTLPEWSGIKSNLDIWLLQPEEQRRNYPLYVTLDRKQVDLGKRESFTPPAETRTWNSYSLPLKFERQILLDWAIKDVKDVSLYLWWEIAAPRPSLEFSYRLRPKDAFPPLLSSPRGDQYIVYIPLEADKPQQSTDTP